MEIERLMVLTGKQLVEELEKSTDKYSGNVFRDSLLRDVEKLREKAERVKAAYEAENKAAIDEMRLKLGREPRVLYNWFPGIVPEPYDMVLSDDVYARFSVGGDFFREYTRMVNMKHPLRNELVRFCDIKDFCDAQLDFALQAGLRQEEKAIVEEELKKRGVECVY